MSGVKGEGDPFTYPVHLPLWGKRCQGSSGVRGRGMSPLALSGMGYGAGGVKNWSKESIPFRIRRVRSFRVKRVESMVRDMVKGFAFSG